MQMFAQLLDYVVETITAGSVESECEEWFTLACVIQAVREEV